MHFLNIFVYLFLRNFHQNIFCTFLCFREKFDSSKNNYLNWGSGLSITKLRRYAVQEFITIIHMSYKKKFYIYYKMIYLNTKNLTKIMNTTKSFFLFFLKNGHKCFGKVFFNCDMCINEVYTEYVQIFFWYKEIFLLQRMIFSVEIHYFSKQEKCSSIKEIFDLKTYFFFFTKNVSITQLKFW